MSSFATRESCPMPFSELHRRAHGAGHGHRGVMWTPIEQLSEEGYDLQWGTNVVGHFYFAQLLMPALLAGAQTSPDHHARVITTSSSGAYLQTLEYDTFRDGRARRELGSTQLYYQSKHVRPSTHLFLDWAWTYIGRHREMPS